MFRRLVSLVVLLVLVTLLMQRVSDPQVFENAFRQLGVPLTSSTNLENSDQRTSAEEPSDSRTPKPTSVVAVDSWRLWSRDIWSYLLRSASQEVRNDLAGHVFSPSAPRANLGSATQEWIQNVDSTLDRWQSLIALETAQQGGVWKPEHGTEWWVRVVADWATLKGSFLDTSSSWSDLSESSRRGFEDALDFALLDSMRDAAFWSKAERLGLLRAFRRSESIDDSLQEPSYPISVGSLLNAPDRTRGRWIRLRGSVVRDATQEQLRDELPGEKDGSGGKKYFLFWLRPADGSDQPLCFYLSEERWQQLQNTRSLGQAPSDQADGVQRKDSTVPELLQQRRDSKNDPWMLDIDCMFVKRLAYRSQRGIDVAPLMIVRDVRRASRDTLSTGLARLAQPQSPWKPPSPQLAAIPILVDSISQPLQEINPASLSADLAQQPQDDPSLSVRQNVNRVLRILHQSRRVPEALREMAKRQIAIGPYRGRLARGIVTSCQPLAISPDDAEWFGSTYIYLLQLEEGNPLGLLSSSSTKNRAALAIVPSVPRSWLDQAVLNQPVSLSAIDLSTEAIAEVQEDDQSASPSSLLLCGEIDWSWKAGVSVTEHHPKLPPHFEWLGEHGWNLVDAEWIAGLQKQPMNARETKPLLSLLRIADEQKDMGADWPLKPIGIQPIFEKPRENVLSWSSLTMRTVRVRRVTVSEDASQDWLEGKDYFEIDGFVRLDGFQVRLQTQPEDPQPLVFEDEFPMTVVCRTLPAWLMPSSIPIPNPNDMKGKEQASGQGSESSEVSDSDNVWYPRELVQVQGFFYRFWSYTSQLPDGRSLGSSEQNSMAADQSYRQVGPIVISVQLSRAPPLETQTVRRQLDQISGFFAIGLLIVVYIAWRTTRFGRKARKR